MSEQHQKGMLVRNCLKGLGMHPVTIAEAISDENFRRSYDLIQANPQITKDEFLAQMQIEEYEY